MDGGFRWSGFLLGQFGLNFQVRTLSFREGTDYRLLSFSWVSRFKPLDMYLELQTLYIYINGCLVKASIFYIKIWNHQMETVIYTWVYQIRGINGINYPPVDGRTPAPARMYKPSWIRDQTTNLNWFSRRISEPSTVWLPPFLPGDVMPGALEDAV